MSTDCCGFCSPLEAVHEPLSQTIRDLFKLFCAVFFAAVVMATVGYSVEVGGIMGLGIAVMFFSAIASSVVAIVILRHLAWGSKFRLGVTDDGQVHIHSGESLMENTVLLIIVRTGWLRHSSLHGVAAASWSVSTKATDMTFCDGQGGKFTFRYTWLKLKSDTQQTGDKDKTELEYVLDDRELRRYASIVQRFSSWAESSDAALSSDSDVASIPLSQSP